MVESPSLLPLPLPHAKLFSRPKTSPLETTTMKRRLIYGGIPSAQATKKLIVGFERVDFICFIFLTSCIAIVFSDLALDCSPGCPSPLAVRMTKAAVSDNILHDDAEKVEVSGQPVVCLTARTTQASILIQILPGLKASFTKPLCRSRRLNGSLLVSRWHMRSVSSPRILKARKV